MTPREPCGLPIRNMYFDPISSGERNETDCTGELGRTLQLVVRSHRRRRVDQQPDRQVVLGVIEPNEELVEARQRQIVDPAKVVTGLIFAEVGEVER